MRRRLAYAALAFAACGAVMALPSSGPHRKGEAAIAIRDNVPAYQRFFTERYTTPRLEAAYEQYWYIQDRDVVPSDHAIEKALDEATTKYDHVDLYLLAHGNHYIDAVRTLRADQRAKLRLVYDTGGNSAWQGEQWMALGVGTFIGHPGGNIAPAFYVWFMPEWLDSQDAPKAMKQANAQVHDLLYGPVGGVANHWLDRDALWAGTEARLFSSPGGSAERRSEAPR